MSVVLVEAPVVRRLVSLAFGLWLFGLGVALIVAADLGADPWTVLHEGISLHTPLSLGSATVAVSFVVLLFWIPLRQRVGIGTVGNAVAVGLVMDLVLYLLPDIEQLALRVLSLLLGVVVVGIASGFYIGAGLGPGPRDGLMTGLARFGWPVRRIRTLIELSALLIGVLFGGTVGIGTVVFAVGIGPIVHVTLPLLAIPPSETSS